MYAVRITDPQGERDTTYVGPLPSHSVAETVARTIEKGWQGAVETYIEEMHVDIRYAMDIHLARAF